MACALGTLCQESANNTSAPSSDKVINKMIVVLKQNILLLVHHLPDFLFHAMWRPACLFSFSLVSGHQLPALVNF